jgi:flagellar protein FlgJ
MDLPSLSSEHIIQTEVFNQKPNRNADLREVAEQFEAIFINQILKQSRETKLADDLFGSSATSTYEQLLDTETSENIASHVNLGIADALVRQFSRDGE